MGSQPAKYAICRRSTLARITRPFPINPLVPGVWCRHASAIRGDDVNIQRHCTISRQGTTAGDACAVVESDAGNRENVPCENFVGELVAPASDAV